MAPVGATVAGLDETSYETDNDAFSATNLGRKRPELLLGGGFILPFRKGGVRIEKAYCGSDKEQREAAEVDQQPTDNCRPGGAYNHYRPPICSGFRSDG
jgi:hypothetical protein